MSRSIDPYTDVADAIVDHARAIIRLDDRTGAFEAAVRSHVDTMRLLAAEHVDPAVDRRFFKALAAAAGDGVFVRFEDGVILLMADHPRQPQRFELLSPAQATRREAFGPTHWN